SDGVFRRLHLELEGLPTVAAVGAAVAEHRPVRTDRPRGKLWINFAGPPGTIPTHSFVDVLRGTTPRRELAGKIVVVGPTASTFQDIKTTGAGGGVMTGAELIANAVNTLARARFGRYMPEQVVDQVLEAADGTGRLEGQELTATVMFADIRGFTTSVESRPASQVIGILDRYLARMSETVMAHGGTVVSYLG